MDKNYSYIWQKRKYPPFLMITVVRATIFGFSKIFPSQIKSGGNYWQDSDSSYFYDKEELDATANRLSKLAMNKHKEIIKFFKISYSKAKKLNLFVKKSLNINKEKDIKEIIHFFRIFIDKFYDFYCYGTIPILLGYSDNVMYKRIDNIISKKTKKNPKNIDLFMNLTVSEKCLINHELELKILTLALKAKDNKIKKLKDISSFFKEDIASLVEKYSFLSFDLLNNIAWDEKHFAKNILEKSVKTSLIEDIHYFRNYSKITKKRIKMAEQNLGLNEKEKNIFKIARLLSYYKWAREYEFVEAVYNFSILLNRLGKLVGLSSLESKYLILDDFVNKKIDAFLIKQRTRKRLKSFLFAIVDKQEKFLYGQKARSFYKKLSFTKEVNTEKYWDKKLLKGRTAYVGKVMASIKIINVTEDMKKMNKGDVLVSVATTPEIIKAMKKAAAIITDEGGITCHAAIVSRELKTPCVIGTKIATKVLKDGDLVEVDANKGQIKIIK